MQASYMANRMSALGNNVVFNDAPYRFYNRVEIKALDGSTQMWRWPFAEPQISGASTYSLADSQEFLHRVRDAVCGGACRVDVVRATRSVVLSLKCSVVATPFSHAQCVSRVVTATS